MWEFELICDLKDAKYMRYIQDKLAEPISQAGGVMATVADREYIYLSLGVKLQNMPAVKTQLRLILTEVFCQLMKYDFLKENIDLPSELPDYAETFLKVCTYFDRETERHMVLKLLKLSGKKLNLKSLLYFRMQGLISKWSELCELANQNSITILKKDNFIEFLRFLLGSIDSKCQSVILELKDKCLIYHDQESDFDIITSIDVNDGYDILSKLIDLNPYLIKVHKSESGGEIVSLLRSVFDDRVEVGN